MTICCELLVCYKNENFVQESIRELIGHWKLMVPVSNILVIIQINCNWVVLQVGCSFVEMDNTVTTIIAGVITLDVTMSIT